MRRSAAGVLLAAVAALALLDACQAAGTDQPKTDHSTKVLAKDGGDALGRGAAENKKRHDDEHHHHHRHRVNPKPLCRHAAPPPSNAAAFTCRLPAHIGQQCSGACATNYSASATDGAPQAVCMKDGWQTSGSCCANAGQACTDATECCSATCQSDKCCVADQGSCQTNDECCSGTCSSNTCQQPCFSGDTRVRVLGQAEPVAMRDLRTGEYVQCVNTTADLTAPTTLGYCLVRNWAHAQDDVITQVRLNFTAPGGGAGSLTVSPTHFVMTLPSATLGATGTSVADFGEFELVPARDVAVGALLAVLTNATDPAAGFTVVAVGSTGRVDASGQYVPAIESTYLVADGVAMPTAVNVFFPLANTVPGAKLAAIQMQFSEHWMEVKQPLGTPGIDGQWPGPGGAPVAPFAWPVIVAKRPHILAGESLDFAAFSAWYAPRLAAWRANGTVTRATDVAAYLTLNSSWVRP